MKILMLSSEAYPYAKTGGLADAVSSLADSLTDLGHDVRVFVPEYTETEEKTFVIAGDEAMGFAAVPYQIDRLGLGTRFELLSIHQPRLYDRKGLYGDGEQPEFSDNTKRFSLLYRAALSACRDVGWTPDVIHAHDWHTSPAMRYRHRGFPDRFYGASTGVLTIHNYGYKGYFPVHDIHYTGLEREDFCAAISADTSAFSFLHCGLRFADHVTTVSPTYAREITAAGEKEDPVVRPSRPITGILNGIDYTLWNPENDRFLPYRFSRHDIAGKRANKNALQKELGLQVNSEIPLIGMVGRLAGQKGIDELLKPGYGCLPSMCRELPAQFVVLGTGEGWAEIELKRMNGEYSNLAALVQFSEALAHKIEAASDFFLMPSRYEPCGLNQLYSLAYGSLPIVTQTGGLVDTVDVYNPDTGEGTGFRIIGTSPKAIAEAVRHATDVWYTRPAHIELMRNRAMGKRFTWMESAKRYEEVFRTAIIPGHRPSA